MYWKVRILDKEAPHYYEDLFAVEIELLYLNFSYIIAEHLCIRMISFECSSCALVYLNGILYLDTGHLST